MRKDVMKKYMLLMVAIIFSHHCQAALWYDSVCLEHLETSAHDANNEKAYKEALNAYQDWMNSFGEQAYKHSLDPDKYAPISHARFFIEWYKILQTYCKKTTPSFRDADQETENKCAARFAQKIQNDPKFFLEGKRLLLSMFHITNFAQIPGEFIESIIEEKE